MIDVFSLSVEEMASKIKDGLLTSVEICEKYIERIQKFEKAIKAWAHFDKKILLEKASDADEHRKSGKPLGKLHGVPVAIKDIIGTVDMPTAFAQRVFTALISAGVSNCGPLNQA